MTSRQESGRGDAPQRHPDRDTNVDSAMYVSSTTTSTVVHTTQISAREQYGLSKTQHRRFERNPQRQERQERQERQANQGGHQEEQHHGHNHAHQERPRTRHTHQDKPLTHHTHGEGLRQSRPHPERHHLDPYNKHAREQHRTSPSGQNDTNTRMGNNTPNQREWSNDVQGGNS